MGGVGSDGSVPVLCVHIEALPVPVGSGDRSMMGS